MTRHNKLEGLLLVTLSSQVLESEGKARVNPMEQRILDTNAGKQLYWAAKGF